jgi:hypothetical protein
MSGATQPESGMRSAERPTIVHITHWKAGSQWLYHILHQCCPDRIVAPKVDEAHFLKEQIVAGKIYPTVYLPRQVVERVRVPADTRFFVVLRDPRDTLISLYYSQKISHVLDKKLHVAVEAAASGAGQGGRPAAIDGGRAHAGCV